MLRNSSLWCTWVCKNSPLVEKKTESAEIWHVYSFLVKKCPCGFFSWMQNHIDKILLRPNNVEFRSLRAKTLCMCLLHYWREIEGGGGGWCKKVGGVGWTFKNVFEALLPHLWKKKPGTFFNTKRVDMPNFSRFGATWKIATKSSFRAGLHGALQFKYHDHMNYFE